MSEDEQVLHLAGTQLENGGSSNRGDYTTGCPSGSDNIDYSLFISAKPSTLSVSTCGRGSRNCDSLLAGVDDEPLAAQKTYERQSKFTRELYGEARRRRYRCQQRNAGGERFLHDLESAAAADEQHMSAEGQAAFQERPPDYLVHGVVPADIFAQYQQFSAGVKKRRGVQAASPAKDGLRCAQLLRAVGTELRDRTASSTSGRRRPRRRSCAMDAFPHTPQAEPAENLRAALRAARRTLESRVTRTRLRSGAASPGRRNATRCSRRERMPSVKRKPATSSSSFPGVRRVTPREYLPARISSGSSAAR